MLIRRAPQHPIFSSEITPETIYRDRRRFLGQLGLGAISLAMSGCGKAGSVAPAATPPAQAAAEGAGSKPGTLMLVKKTDFAGKEAPTPFQDVTHYNNYYEFGTAKEEPAQYAGTLKTRPWTVQVEGECDAPATLGIDDLLKLFPLEERIYRHRCVEGWSIVVPWDGFALGPFLARFKPNSRAKFVRFISLYDPRQMPQAGGVLPWPYTEALRIDEAMQPLAFLSVGLYGQDLPNQNGAPLRLTLPWKYGFKSGKSIVKIEFTERAPLTTWNESAPDEYGFYANVNPSVDHPRWSQKTERRLGELFKRPTLMFNGYPEVASLYSGMDLRANF